MAKLKKAKKAKAQKSAKSFDFQNFLNSFNSLDPQNMGTWPLVVKLTLAGFIVAIIFLLAYLLPIKSKIADIKAAEAEEKSLLDTYREKESKARNLKAYKEQVRQMEATLDDLLKQLPEDTKIPDLVEDINMRGVSSGVEFRDISVKDEVTRELFIEQPIEIKAKGDYHKFGRFVSGVAGLPRIITMDNFVIENPETSNLSEIPSLELTLNAKTYRSRPETAEGKEDDKEEKK